MSGNRFNQLREAVLRRAGAVGGYMPHDPRMPPGDRTKTVEDMKTSGTKAHAFMSAICAVISEELARQEFEVGLVTENDARAEEAAALAAIDQSNAKA